MTAPSEPPGEDDDDDAFRRAVTGVRPLSAGRAAAPSGGPRPRVRAIRARPADVLREHLPRAREPVAVDSGGHASFRRARIPEDVLRRLRRGQYAVEAEIDLHGLHREAAHDALRQFLAESVLHGLRCVRVIHGKGLRSGPGGPVLKHVVDQWLRDIDVVAAFTSARPADGGTGALYVLLRS